MTRRYLIVREVGRSPRSDSGPFVVGELCDIPSLIEDEHPDALPREEAEQFYPVAVAAWDRRDDSAAEIDAANWLEEGEMLEGAESSAGEDGER